MVDESLIQFRRTIWITGYYAQRTVIEVSSEHTTSWNGKEFKYHEMEHRVLMNSKHVTIQILEDSHAKMRVNIRISNTHGRNEHTIRTRYSNPW